MNRIIEAFPLYAKRETIMLPAGYTILSVGTISDPNSGVPPCVYIELDECEPREFPVVFQWFFAGEPIPDTLRKFIGSVKMEVRDKRTVHVYVMGTNIL